MVVKKNKIGLHSYFNLPTYYLNPTESEIRIIGYLLFRMSAFLRCSFFPMWIIYLIFCQGFNMTWWYHMNMSDLGRLKFVPLYFICTCQAMWIGWEWQDCKCRSIKKWIEQFCIYHLIWTTQIAGSGFVWQ